MKRFISILLCILMALSMVPATAFATEQMEVPQGSAETGEVIQIKEDFIDPNADLIRTSYNASALSLFQQAGSDYAFKDLAKRSNGSGRQQLYSAIYDTCCTFYNSTKDLGTTQNYYVLEIFDLTKYGLTLNEATETYFVFKHDNPIFYFLDNRLLVSDTALYVLVTDDCVKADTRASYNSIIENKLEEYKSVYTAESGPYQALLAVHKKLCKEMEYAYEADGETPKDAPYAHSVIGAFKNGNGVCEAYARALNLVLNYCGVNNMVVTGTSQNENHIWNLVELKGNYYWVDATWNDSRSDLTYFCKGGKTFVDHVYYTPKNTGPNFLYALPSNISEVDYTDGHTHTFVENRCNCGVWQSLSQPTLDSIANKTGGVRLTWNEVKKAEQYHVYRRKSGGKWASLGYTSGTSYTDSTAVSGTKYDYTVCCCSKDKSIDLSSYSKTGLEIIYLSPIRKADLTVSNKDDYIKVSWPKVTGASGYYVYRRLSGTEYKRIATIKSGSTLSYKDKEATKNGRAYYYCVKAYKESYKGAATSRACIRLSKESISSITTKTGGFKVVWKENTKATGYQIRFAPDADFTTYNTAKIKEGDVVAATVSSLKSRTTYYVKVRSYKTSDAGNTYYSPWSTVKKVTTK